MILSDIVVYTKYAKYIKETKTRETWRQLCHRNMTMHQEKYPDLRSQISQLYEDFVMPKKVLPSMRSLQFAGDPIALSPNRIFNCAFAPVDHPDIFSEIMFLLLGGTGAGYSVQKQHVEKLPKVLGVKTEERRYVVGDSIEGWADAVKVLVESHFHRKEKIRFDYNDIRDKGAELVTSGGKAPGPEPLRRCIQNVARVLAGAVGRHLRPIEAHDMICFIADAVLAGGIRRAALICLFSRCDTEMLNCKHPDNVEQNTQRFRANNSVVLPRGEVSEEEFKYLWERVQASKMGEPGFYWTNDTAWGTNPCCEIALRPFQFCNLTEINATTVKDQVDFNERCKAASFLGTLQAGYTDFHYLRPIWKKTTEKDDLLGIGITGIASGTLDNIDLGEGAHHANLVNKEISDLIGVNPAARITTVKPSGTSSLVVGSSSGIHAWHSEYYIRRMKLGKNEAIYKYLKSTIPELLEDDFYAPDTSAFICVPQKAPEFAVMRTESPEHLLGRVERFNRDWIAPGHWDGKNKHNVSCTISLKDDEWERVGTWMWENRKKYNGISVLPYDGGNHKHLPFEDCTREYYEQQLQYLKEIDLSLVLEDDDNTDLTGELACAGGACEIL